MQKIPASDLYYPNNLSHIYLLSIEDVIGENGVKAILNSAGLSELIGNYPPYNTENGFDFSKFSMIIGTLDELYGKKGSKVLSMRAGNALFAEMLKVLGEPEDIHSPEFQSKPLIEKIHTGLSVARRTFSKTKTEPIPQMDDGSFYYSVKYCPVCWGRTTDSPDCFLVSGMLQAAVRWSTGGMEFPVTQKTAHSCGDATCDFVIPVTPA